MLDPGKAFEKDFKESAIKYFDDVSIDRLYDNVGGYAGIRNVCDFILYHIPNQYYFELKSHLEDALPISCITDYQYKGLLVKSQIRGVIAGVLMQFRPSGQAYFVPIQKIKELRDNGAVKITLNDAKKYGKSLPIIKKRVKTYDYNVKALLEDLQHNSFRGE